MTTRWQDIYNRIKDRSIDVYPPAGKRGECSAPYCVVLQEGSQRHAGFSTDIDFYSVLCYVPDKRYSLLAEFVNTVKDIMSSLRPMIVPTGSQSEPFLDEDVRAFMVSIEYRNYRKI